MSNEVGTNSNNAFHALRDRLLAERPNAELAGVLGVLSFFVALIFGGALLSAHAGDYTSAGVPSALAGGGAFVAQLVVAAMLFLVTTLLLHGDQRAYLLAPVTGAVALGFGLLPALVGPGNWLAVLLLVLVTLVFDAVIGVAIFFIAFFAGLGHSPETAERK
jgi:hypothetical protein